MKYYLIHQSSSRAAITFASFGSPQDLRNPPHLPFVDSPEDIVRMLFRGLQNDRRDATAFKRDQVERVKARGVAIWGPSFFHTVFSIVPEDLLCDAN